MPSIADLFVSVTSDVSGAISGLTTVDEKVNGTSAAMAAAAPAGYALAGAATAVGGAFLSSISVASGFEHEMSGVKAVLAPDEVIQFGSALTDLALKLGKDTVFSSNQAASAIEELVKSGVDVQTVLNGGAASALSLAAATGINVRQAAEFAGTALNTFHESADQLNHTVDTLSGVANASAADIGDLQFAFQSVGSVAASLGLSFDDTAIALGAFADNGLRGSDAGTSLKTMLLNLIPSTNSQVAAFQQLGLYSVDTTAAITQLGTILQGQGAAGMQALTNASKDGNVTIQELFNSVKTINPQLVNGATTWQAWAQNVGLTSNAFFDASGKAKSMSEIFGILQQATAGLTNEQKINLLQTAFGTDAVRAATIAASEGAAGFDNLAANVAKVSAADAAATRLNNLNGSLNQLGGSFETVQITIGTLFLPVIRQIVDDTTALLNAFLSLDPGIQTTIVAIVGIAGAAAGLLAGFILLGPVLGAVGAAFGIIAGVVAAAALPIVALVAAGALLYEAWQTDFGGIREVTEQVWAALQPGFQNIIVFLGVIRDTLGPTFSQTQSNLGPFIEQLSQALAPLLARLPDLIRLIGDAFNAVSPIFQAFIGFLGSLDYTGVANFFGGIGSAILQFLDAINRLLSGDFSGAWASFWGAFTTVLSTVFTAQVEILQALLGAIGNFVQQLPGIVAANVPGMWQALLDEFGRLPGQLQPYWDNFAGWLGGVLAGVPQFIGDAAGDVWAALRAAFDGLVGQLGPAWDVFAGWLGSVVGGIAQFVADNMGDIFGPLAGAFAGLVDLLAPAWDIFAGWLAAVVGGIGQFVVDNMGDIWGGLVAAFFGLVDQLAPAWDAFAGWLGNVLAGLPQFVADHIGDVWGALIAAFTGSTPGTTTTTGGGTPAPAPGPVGTGGGITGPLVSIGTINVGTVAEQDAFLQQMSDAILAAAQRLTTPPAASSPFLP